VPLEAVARKRNVVGAGTVVEVVTDNSPVDALKDQPLGSVKAEPSVLSSAQVTVPVAPATEG